MDTTVSTVAMDRARCLKAIGDIRSRWDPHALDESARILEQDPRYLNARLALADRAEKFAERVKR